MLPPLVRKRPVEALIFLVMALSVLLLPAARQVGEVRSRHYPEWAMFRAASRGQYRVHYFQITGDERIPVDRISVFGWEDQRPHRLTILDDETVRKQGQKLCRKLKTKELFAEVHRSTMRGWKRVNMEGENLCTRPRKGRKKR